MIAEGQLAPDFTLPDQDGKPVSLKDFRGKWVVLYFYPKDDTSGCTAEACDFTHRIADFTRLDAVILGVSPDAPECHRKFIAKYDLKVTLLADESHQVLEQYGSWQLKKNYGKEYMGVQRSTFLIDPQGKVVKAWPRVTVNGHVDEVHAVIQQARG